MKREGGKGDRGKTGIIIKKIKWLRGEGEERENNEQDKVIKERGGRDRDTNKKRRW